MPAERFTESAKVDALRRPALYPGAPATVEVVETHMSWVFLAGERVYKLKKPVHYDHLDFSTIAARRHYCNEEIRLNRRLAGTVYLDVVPLRADAGGGLHLGGEGEVVDWLVRMRRLPAGAMLDQALARGTATARDLRGVAARLAAFYQSLPPAPIDAPAYVRGLRIEIEDCRRELCEPAFALPADRVRVVCGDLLAVLARHREALAQRVRAGRIVEGHGDLRPEHVCLDPPFAIIDCLEFSPALRTQDALDDLGFLALECERLGAPDFARILFEVYGEITGDAPAAPVRDFYQGYRAVVRAKISIRHLREARFRDSPKWPDRARQYLRLAEGHIGHCVRAPGAPVSPPAAR